jgi:hypothetical protein
MEQGRNTEIIKGKKVKVWRISNYMPTPERLLEENLSENEKKELINIYGFDNWSDWRCSNWGTHWDCDDIGFEWSTDEKSFYILDFESAWSPPIQFLIRVSFLFPSLSFQLEYIEPGCLFAGVNYVNNTDINITKIDYSEVIKVKSATIKTSINVLTGNGYNVSKYKVITNVSKLDYIIGASGMYGEYCGTDNNQNFIFKVLQETTIIDNKNNVGIVIPIYTKIILATISSNEYNFEKKNKLINDVNNNNSELQTTVNKVVNKTYDSITSIGNAENVIRVTGGGMNKKYTKTRNHNKIRVKSLIKKHSTRKNYGTRKNNKK